MSAPPAQSRAQKRAQRWAETKVDLKWAVALLFVLILALSGFLWDGWSSAPTYEEDLSAVTHTIFAVDGLVAPFEILSVLLLAALIAGVVIAFRDPEEEGPGGFVPPESAEQDPKERVR